MRALAHLAPTTLPSMPRTSDPDRYPPEFFDLLRRASAGEVISIPPAEGKGPAGLRGYLQAFLRACETRAEWADAAKQISVTVEDGMVRVSHRSNGRYAALVRQALGTAPIADQAAEAEKALLQTLNFPL